MKNGVNGTHRVRKTESKGKGTRLSNNRERTMVFFGELRGRTSGAEVLGFNEDLLSNL